MPGPSVPVEQLGYGTMMSNPTSNSRWQQEEGETPPSAEPLNAIGAAVVTLVIVFIFYTLIQNSWESPPDAGGWS
jgi:hypothetical protein